MKKRTVLITGPTTGIGYELTQLFAHDGYHLVLVSRNLENLVHLSQELQTKLAIEVKIIAKDLSRREAVAEIYEELEEASIAIDILVNNAGFGYFGLFNKSEITENLDMIELNIAVPTYLTRLLLPHMLKQRWGKILNVVSIAAFQPGPLMAVYYATKAYFLSFSEALAEELRGTGVTVTSLCPGPTRTGFHKRAHMESLNLTASKLMPLMDPTRVALKGYNGLMKGQRIVIPGLIYKIMALFPRFLPRNVVTRAVRIMQERRKGSKVMPQNV